MPFNSQCQLLSPARPQSTARRNASGQHADFGIGRRYLRMAISLMRTSQVYLPPNLRKFICHRIYERMTTHCNNGRVTI
jgi:RNase P subunit RPR2